jgi:hypothetical protein
MAASSHLHPLPLVVGVESSFPIITSYSLTHSAGRPSPLKAEDHSAMQFSSSFNSTHLRYQGFDGTDQLLHQIWSLLLVNTYSQNSHVQELHSIVHNQGRQPPCSFHSFLRNSLCPLNATQLHFATSRSLIRVQVLCRLEFKLGSTFFIDL